ncbi:hypothetical protein ACVIIV_005093 [Bradyrhizobium sp. USDA 4354]
MNHNTLNAFRDANAAADYLASDEFYDESDVIAYDVALQTTARSLRPGLGLARDRYLSGSLSTCSQGVGKSGWMVIGYLPSGSEQQLYLVEAKDEKPLFAPAQTVADKIVRELGRVRDGWAGPGTVAPSKRVLADVETVAMRLPLNLKTPLIDIDEEDGSVALRWIAADKESSFSLVFRGNGKVLGVLATIEPPRSVSWSLGVREEVQIAFKLDENLVRNLIAS